MSLIKSPNKTNPYPSEFALLFWHDFWKQMVEDHGADWRDQSAYVNANIPEIKSFNSEMYWKPWKAIKEAYEAKCRELDAALEQLDEHRQLAMEASEV